MSCDISVNLEPGFRALHFATIREMMVVYIRMMTEYLFFYVYLSSLILSLLPALSQPQFFFIRGVACILRHFCLFSAFSRKGIEKSGGKVNCSFTD